MQLKSFDIINSIQPIKIQVVVLESFRICDLIHI